jgi:Coenzyme PQQ synthesis protein D (PqqD)
VPDSVVTREVGNAILLLDIETGRSFRLDEPGARAWKVLTSAPSIRRAFETLLAEFQVEPDRLKQDLETLVETLDAQGLLNVRPV